MSIEELAGKTCIGIIAIFIGLFLLLVVLTVLYNVVKFVSIGRKKNKNLSDWIKDFFENAMVGPTYKAKIVKKEDW